jgi:hypothetical protein
MMPPRPSGRLKIPPALRKVLEERIDKLRSKLFPRKQADALIQEILDITEEEHVIHRFHLDLVIVTTSIAHAFDLDDKGEYVIQEQFRDRDYLATALNNRSEFLDLERRNHQLEGATYRPLRLDERLKFIAMHAKCREPIAPLLSDEEMKEFLDAQTICELNRTLQQANFHGISSFDGTFIYVVSDADEITVCHELEHNIRIFLEDDLYAKASHVSAVKDPTLRINGVQCEAGFVSEYRNGRAVDGHLVSPFSARWARVGYR